MFRDAGVIARRSIWTAPHSDRNRLFAQERIGLDYVLQADSVPPPVKLAVYPADLNQGGNLCRHLSKLEQTLEKNGLLRSSAGKETEPPVGDVLHSCTQDLCFFRGLKRRQLASLEFSLDGIARIASFCPRLPRINLPEDPQTIFAARLVSRKLQSFTAGGLYLGAIFQSCRIFAKIPARLEAPLLNMTDRRKAFAVFGLMSIRQAICLVVYPCIRRLRASISRCVK